MVVRRRVYEHTFTSEEMEGLAQKYAEDIAHNASGPFKDWVCELTGRYPVVRQNGRGGNDYTFGFENETAMVEFKLKWL